jgi:hypothetical protein
MKKIVFILAALVIAAAAYASTAIVVSPSSMKEGETKTLTDDGTTVKVTRHGDDVDIRVEGAGESRTITVTRGGDGDIEIHRDGRRMRIITPDVVVPPVHVPQIHVPRFHDSRFGTIFVCPKDGTTLRVPDAKDKDKDKEFKCPVDGTTMEKKKGRGFSFYFDEGDFDAFEL